MQVMDCDCTQDQGRIDFDQGFTDGFETEVFTKGRKKSGEIEVTAVVFRTGVCTECGRQIAEVGEKDISIGTGLRNLDDY